MSFRSLFLLKITISQDGHLDFFSIFMTVVGLAVVVLLGIWLWLIGLDLARGGTWPSRLGGWAVLAVASAYTLALAWLVYWEMSEVLEWF
jgi:hypothetical protein